MMKIVVYRFSLKYLDLFLFLLPSGQVDALVVVVLVTVRFELLRMQFISRC